MGEVSGLLVNFSVSTLSIDAPCVPSVTKVKFCHQHRPGTDNVILSDERSWRGSCRDANCPIRYTTRRGPPCIMGSGVQLRGTVSVAPALQLPTSVQGEFISQLNVGEPPHAAPHNGIAWTHCVREAVEVQRPIEVFPAPDSYHFCMCLARSHKCAGNPSGTLNTVGRRQSHPRIAVAVGYGWRQAHGRRPVAAGYGSPVISPALSDAHSRICVQQCGRDTGCAADITKRCAPRSHPKCK
jgi:hypothetical protein